MKCRINAKKQLRQFENVMLKITLWKLSRSAAHMYTRTLIHIHSDAPAQKRNGMFELDNIEFMCFVIHHVGWLMNYHHHHHRHPRLYNWCFHSWVCTMYALPLLRIQRKRNKWEKSGLPVCYVTTVKQPHGIFLPSKVCYAHTHTLTIKMNAPRDCQNNASTSNWLAMNLL